LEIIQWNELELVMSSALNGIYPTESAQFHVSVVLKTITLDEIHWSVLFRANGSTFNA